MSTTQDNPTGSIIDKLPLPKLDAYFIAEPSTKFWILDDRKIWRALTKDMAVMEASMIGHRRRLQRGEENTPAEIEVHRVVKQNSIDFAGPVAGHEAGIYEDGPHKFLATQSPYLIEPKKGDWPNIKKLAERLFGETQLPYVLGWSKTALRGMYFKEFKQKQVLIFAGPPGCGKSFWQNKIITPMLGGRMAKPIQYMMGKTTFNEDLIKSEHLMLEDENVKTDMASRRQLGAEIKNFAVNGSQRNHGKNKSAYQVPSKHWLTMSLNEEIDCLSILPPLDESMKDKEILLKCKPGIVPNVWPEIPMSDFEVLIATELPAFIWYLLHEHVISEEHWSLRYGVRDYQDADLVAAIELLTPESELDSMIEGVFRELAKERKSETIRLEDLFYKLHGDPDVGKRAQKLIPSQRMLAVYLNSLSKTKIRKYVHKKFATHNAWLIDWSA